MYQAWVKYMTNVFNYNYKYLEKVQLQIQIQILITEWYFNYNYKCVASTSWGLKSLVLIAIKQFW